jgi:CrcB protein
VSVLIVALAGSLGAVSRFILAGAVQDRTRAAFPVGTLVVNVVGSFGLGVLVAAAPAETELVIAAVGLFGGFTTFSTWTIESVRLGVLPTPSRPAVINVFGMPALALLSAALGYYLAVWAI